jgi:hypothetical protein
VARVEAEKVAVVAEHARVDAVAGLDLLRDLSALADPQHTPVKAVGDPERWQGSQTGPARGINCLACLLLGMAGKGRHLLAPVCQEALVRVRQLAEKGFGRDALVFVALLGSGLAAVAYVAVGKASLAMVCCLLAVFMGAGLLIGYERGGDQ